MQRWEVTRRDGRRGLEEGGYMQRWEVTYVPVEATQLTHEAGN